jgi:hypothetical protein
MYIHTCTHAHISFHSSNCNLLLLGPTLDAFARRHLWQRGLDYMHGTGHGVGSFLNVHEGTYYVRAYGAYIYSSITSYTYAELSLTHSHSH